MKFLKLIFIIAVILAGVGLVYYLLRVCPMDKKSSGGSPDTAE